MNWLGHEGLRPVQTLNDKEKVKCKTSYGLFEVLSDKFEPQHNETILSFQHCKNDERENENVEEWMGCLTINANECGYTANDRSMKEQVGVAYMRI